MYPDGWSIYAVHGVGVPEYIIKTPQKINVKDIESEQNQEIKRVKIDIYGKDRYLKDSGGKLIHQDGLGKLWRKEINGDEPLVMVEVINSTPELDGSFHTYFLRVPPHIETAQAAVAWTFSKEAKSYKPLIET
jgi:hypothetical protein